MKPTIGRIVHYTNLGDADGRYPPEQQAAIVTGIYPASHPDREGPQEGDIGERHVDLHIFYKTGQFDMRAVPYSEKYERGHWSWPTKVKE